MTTRRLWSRSRDDSGAAALEFALVSVVLFPLVFGMIDYGLFFTDSIGARDGARVAARQGAVENFTGACPAGKPAYGTDPDLDALACLALDQTNAVGGTAYAKVTNPDPWQRGNDLLVCVAVEDEGVTGIIPMPNGRSVHARLRLRIEQDTKKNGAAAGLTGEANSGSTASSPPGLWDTWCD